MFATQITSKRFSLPTAIVALVVLTSSVNAFTLTDLNLAGTLTRTNPPPTTKTANPSKSVGNSYAGASINFPIRISNENGCREIKVVASSKVNILKKSATAVEFETFVKSCSNGTRTGGLKVKIAGFTVALDNRSVSFTFVKTVTKSIVSASTTVWVGPVPVTVRGSVAGTFTTRVAFSITGDDVGLSGPLSASMKGSASGSIGVPGYSVGLEAVLDLLKSTITPALTATTARLSGSLQLCFEPLIIKLNLVVKFWPFSWSENLASYSLAKECTTPLSL